MRIALEQGLPRLKPHPIDPEKRINIVCFGPSLRKTWEKAVNGWPIATVSGAHDFLIERGVIPDFHLDCDPRKHKVQYIRKPHKNVHYLMGTSAHPLAWELLKGHKVTQWHMRQGPKTGEWIVKNDPGTLMFDGGSTVALQAIHVLGSQGYAKFNLFGLDGCFEGEDFHASPAKYPKQTVVHVECEGRMWKTTDLMVNMILEFLRNRDAYDIELNVFGDGLLNAMCREADRKNLEERLGNSVSTISVPG